MTNLVDPLPELAKRQPLSHSSKQKFDTLAQRLSAQRNEAIATTWATVGSLIASRKLVAGSLARQGQKRNASGKFK